MKFANSERIRSKKSLDWNTLRVKVQFYSIPLTNSANELINQLRCNFRVPGTSLIHRLMKIPANRSSNNRRTIKSSPLNRTPTPGWIRRAIKASRTEQRRNSRTSFHAMNPLEKNPPGPRQEVLALRLMASGNCFRLRGVSGHDSHRVFQLLQKITGSPV